MGRPGQEAKFGRPTCPKCIVVAEIQYGTCSKRFQCACGGAVKDINELHCRTSLAGFAHIAESPY